MHFGGVSVAASVLVALLQRREVAPPAGEGHVLDGQVLQKAAAGEGRASAAPTVCLPTHDAALVDRLRRFVLTTL
jgi:hypothetical protein